MLRGAYNNDNKVQASPNTWKISIETECNPFEKHLHCKQYSKHQVDNFQDKLQFFVVLQVNIFKAEGKAETVKLNYLNEKKNIHLEAKISNNIVHSKKGLSTMSWMMDLNRSHLPWIQDPSMHEQHLKSWNVPIVHLDFQ